MVRGPKPVPSAVKLTRGNPGKRKIAKDEFKPAWGRISCPKHLEREARKEFRRLLKVLGSGGHAGGSDGAVDPVHQLGAAR
jgi:phage terminase small subunit